MTDAAIDVLAMGNAVVDMIATVDPDVLRARRLEKGSMQLVDQDEAERLQASLPSWQTVRGGSAANTVCGLAAFGFRTHFIGQVGNDPLGRLFAAQIAAEHVRFRYRVDPAAPPTGRCLVLVTPDGDRTMRTFPGASQILAPGAIKQDMITRARLVYLEAYMWELAASRALIRTTMAAARGAGRSVAFSLSDAFCVRRHRDDFAALLRGRAVDILFANEAEVLALTRATSLAGALADLAGIVPLAVVTCGAAGALAMSGGGLRDVRAAIPERVLDTTGAGDLFAAGFLAGHLDGRPIADCLTMGACAAAEIIGRHGARVDPDYAARVRARVSDQSSR